MYVLSRSMTFNLLFAADMQKQIDIKSNELQRATATVGKLNIELQDLKVCESSLSATNDSN